MNNQKKYVLIAFLFAFSFNLVARLKVGQTLTYYYEMELEVSKDGKKTPCSGDGQFYTITHNTCYESNKEGMDEGVGHLTYLMFHQEKRVHIFNGESYYGESAFYISEDYSRINIKTTNGKSYVLTRKSAPTSFMASNHKAIKQQIDSILNGGVYVPIVPNSTTEPVSNMPRSTLEYYDCPSCYGSGRCPICSGKGYSYNPYTGNKIGCTSCRYGNCSSCNGSGKKTRIKR